MPADPPSPPAADAMSALVLERRPLTRQQAIIGVVGAILLHLLIWVAIPAGLFQVAPGENVDRFQDFSIELVDPEEEEQEYRYTQTNPDAPANEPDETDRFAARDQQAANPDLPDEIDDEQAPATESEDSIETEQFLTGDLEMPLLAPPPSPESPEPSEQTQEQLPAADQPFLQAIVPSSDALRREVPLFGDLDESEAEEEGIADFDYDQLEEPPTNIADLIEGEEEEGEEEQREESPEIAGSTGQPAVTSSDALQIPSPRPRPQLPRVPPGPVRNRSAGVSFTGTLAIDAKGSKFGEYMERLIETVSINWDQLASDSSHIERNSKVVIRFVLTKEGLVTRMDNIENTAHIMGLRMCRAAIEMGQPYGPWPSDLESMFGDEEEITFTFHYR